MFFFPESIIPKVLDNNDVQSSLSTITNTLTTAFEKHITTEDFMDISVKPAPRHWTYYCMLLSLKQA